MIYIHLESDSDSWRILNNLGDEATRSGAELPKLYEDVSFYSSTVLK